MSLDTREARASACFVGLPWRGQLPAPDGGLDAGDRQQAGGYYRGILALHPGVELVGGCVFLLAARDRELATLARATAFAVPLARPTAFALLARARDFATVPADGAALVGRRTAFAVVARERAFATVPACVPVGV